MYCFTRFPINMSRRAARDMVRSFHKLHAAVAGCFPAGSIPQGERVIWRVDDAPDGGKVLYIVSPTRPSLVGLDEQIGYPDLGPQYKVYDYDNLLKDVEVGKRYAFRLFANTVHSVECSDGKVRRIGHVTPTHRVSWLVGRPDQDHSRAGGAGFEVVDDGAGPEVAVTGMREMEDRKNGNGKESSKITLSCTQFDGKLEVTDADAFRKALVHGMGRARAFGCGMLTVVPL